MAKLLILLMVVAMLVFGVNIGRAEHAETAPSEWETDYEIENVVPEEEVDSMSGATAVTPNDN